MWVCVRAMCEHLQWIFTCSDECQRQSHERGPAGAVPDKRGNEKVSFAYLNY